MNEKLPKPMLDALAREATPAEHPSADALAAFVEHTLAGGDSRKVADHLARCGECREVVFLASNAAEESVAEEEDLMAVAVGRARQQQLVVDYYDSGMAATKLALPQKPRRRWMPRLLWAAPIAAVLLVAAGYFTLGHRGYWASAPKLTASMSREPVAQPPRPQEELTPPQPAPEVAAPGASVKLQLKAPPAKAAAATAAPTVKVSADAYDAMATSAVPPAPAAAPPEKTNTEAAKAAPESVAVTIGGVSRTAPPAPKANAFAPSANESSWQYGQADSLNLSVSRALNAAHPGWRVTVQGHLEHVTPDGWVRVLADETNAFRVVSVVGSEVWAGGNGGALFHSGDGGQHWKKVSLMTANGTETASIVSIRFDNSQHGVATTDNGSSYVTNDGGVSWIRQ